MKLPNIGLGTYRIRDVNAYNTVLSALETGYRLIDTASVYRNEEHVGRAIRDFLTSHPNVQRSDIFVTTKLAPKDQGLDEAYLAALKSLQLLQLDYVDLYLIHWPGKQGLKHDDPRNRKARESSWQALERLKREGKARHIGVSNFTARHLEELRQTSDKVPEVNQCEFHPLLQQSELRAYCQKHGITFQAYSSLGEGQFVNGQRPLAVCEQLAAKYNVSVACVLLKWALAHDVGVIPKSTHPDRIKDNLHAVNALRLTPDDIKAIDALESQLGTVRFCWDPTGIC